MFKPANPSSRIPAVMQAHTKENIIAQLVLTAVFLGGMILHDELVYRREMKRLKTDNNIVEGPW